MKILITRTDRMGDVILSLPAVRQLRKAAPEAHIAFMVSSEYGEFLAHEKYIDEVILYDKKSAQKGLKANIDFILSLRKKNFDLAIALHPGNRVHLILFAAGISRRVGYNRKWPHLLTNKIPHKKQTGEKHEVDYNLDVVSAAGFDIAGSDRKPSVSVPDGAIQDSRRRFKELGLPDIVIAVHAGASCRSKMWPLIRFAETADKLAEKYSAGIVIMGDRSCKEDAGSLAGLMKKDPVDLTGCLKLSQLAAFFSICTLVISNDSGPAHLAAAVGCPVVVIFGRNDPGLSPARWAPVTEKKRIFHSPENCSPCLAHNCNKAFRCLSNITVSEVVSASSELIERSASR